ncbi:unnamed protein product [Oppiella nova]|uniref:Uncharacterized protein n=1 Tax=Oppiella nova TaxID=334625 RepID=A0A7R9LEV4_9ACAR|nr:unnamed protein product [Oppiella nova]CAG2162956.1 unnamed protein product [Oppiella nova]
MLYYACCVSDVDVVFVVCDDLSDTSEISFDGCDVKSGLSLRITSNSLPTFYRIIGVISAHLHTSEAMAGEAVDASKFTGLSKYFNSWTDYGRRNVSLATLSMVGLGILFLVLKPKKQKQIKK